MTVVTTARVRTMRGRGSRLGWQKTRESGPPSGLGFEVLRARCARGLSQSAAAAEIGCSRGRLALVELGEEPRSRLLGMVLEAWIAGRWPVEGR